MADLTPDQTQAPTWGTIAMPTMPSAMAFYSPGIQTMGAVGAQTSFNAVRAQNLAAFDAFQKQNPNATAADLSAAAENITGGDSLLGGAFTPAVMADIANKNKLQLQSQQAVQQGDITATYLTAMEQAINTASDPADWVQKSKALMPQSSWGSFDSFIGGKNTEDMFKVYQQRRVSPIVKDGIAYLWDTLDKYTIAAGGNEKLGKMAMDAAMPQVNAAKLKAAEGIKVDEANIFQSRASGQAALMNAASNQEQSHAAAGASNAETALRQKQLENEKIAGNTTRYDFFNKEVLGDNFTRTSITSGNAVNLKKAHDAQLAAWRNEFGPDHDDEFETKWANADATLAGQNSAVVAAQAKQRAVDTMTNVFGPETDKLKSQVAPDNWELAANGTDTTVLGGLDGDKKKAAQQRAITLTKSLLASKEMITTDADAMKRIIAEGVRDGKSDTEITNTLMNTMGNKGYAVYGPGAGILSKVAFDQPGIHGAVNTGDVLGQVSNNTKDAIEQTDKVMSSLTGKSVRGQVQRAQGDIIADATRVNDVIKKNTADIDRVIFELQDPNLQGEYWGKQDKPAAIHELLEQKRQLMERGNQLARILSNQPVKVATSTVGNNVVVAGETYPINTDGSMISAQDLGAVAGQTRAVVDAQPGSPQGVKYGPPVDDSFLQYLDHNPQLQRITATALREAGRLRGSVTQPAQQNWDIANYNPDTPKAPTELSEDDVKALVTKLAEANKQILGKGTSVTQRNLTSLILLYQAQGKLPGQ